MTLTIDDLANGAEQSTTTDSTNGGASSSTDSLQEVCEEIGADADHARAYVDDNGSKDDLLAYAKWWRDSASDDEKAMMEEYRVMAGWNRIKWNHLTDMDKDFSVWTNAFYGDSDDPDEGTYNWIQQKVRSHDIANLNFHQALFPEAVEAYHDDDGPFLWHRFDDDTLGYGSDAKQDSHVYIPVADAREYSDFTFEAYGETKIRPPTNGEIEANQSDANSLDRAVPFDPSDFTIDELEDELSPVSDFTVEGLEAVLEAEKQGDGRFNDRKNAKKAIQKALDRLRDEQGENTSSSTSSDDDKLAQKAGMMVAQNNLDVNPNAIAGMLKGGMTEEEIVDTLNA